MAQNDSNPEGGGVCKKSGLGRENKNMANFVRFGELQITAQKLYYLIIFNFHIG